MGVTGRLPSAYMAAALFAATALAGCNTGTEEGVLRLGYFPNFTHAQALYGMHTGLFQEHLGETRLKAQVFNAGPTALEALLAGRIDVIYVGPSPTISAIEATGGGIVRIVSGSAAGGASFVLRPDVQVRTDDDYRGLRFASPQLGNTQDIALKAYLRRQGQDPGPGGSVTVINAPNSDILLLFSRGDIDGAWVPEPWASRLVLDYDGVVHIDERNVWPGGTFVTTHVVTTRSFLEDRRDDVLRFLEAHEEATHRIQSQDPEAIAALSAAFTEHTGATLGDAVLRRALSHIEFTDDPIASSFRGQYLAAHQLGMAGEPPEDLATTYDLRLRDEARTTRGNRTG